MIVGHDLRVKSMLAKLHHDLDENDLGDISQLSRALNGLNVEGGILEKILYLALEQRYVDRVPFGNCVTDGALLRTARPSEMAGSMNRGIARRANRTKTSRNVLLPVDPESWPNGN